MKAIRIEIRNFLGIQELVIEPGRVTEIRGPNGSGKTSVLKALGSLLGGGHDVQLIRAGSKKSEVLMELDDGTVLRKVTTQKGSTLRVVRDGEEIPKPQTYVNDLLALDGLNPLAALDPKNRRAFLLEVLDVRITQEELAEMLGADPPPVDCDRHALEVLDDVHRYLFARRKESGKVKRSKEAAAKEGRELLQPRPGDPATLEDRSQEIHQELDAVRVKLGTERAKQEQVDGHAVEMNVAQGAVEKALEKVERLLLALSAAEGDLKEYRGILQGLQKAGAAAGPDQAVIDKAKARIEELLILAIAIGDERTIGAEYDRVSGLDREATEASREWDRLDRQVKAVGPDAQAAVIGRVGLPDGLSFAEGGFQLNDTPIETISQSEVLRLAVRMIKLKDQDKPIKLMLLDGAECLDAASLRELELEQAKDDGWHYVVATVDPDADKPLTVATRDAGGTSGDLDPEVQAVLDADDPLSPEALGL